MIKVFQPTDTNYRTNGDVVLLPTKARVHNADNGEFYLDLICDLKYNDFVKPQNIIVAPTPQGEQAFRIRKVTKTKNRLEVKAYHVYYDTLNYIIVDNYAVNKTCKEAMEYFNERTDNPSPFIVDSDITSLNTYRCVRASLDECFATITERWGGHLVRDNWHIGIYESIGRDNGITIAYSKNLQELTAEYDWSNVVTKLLPVGTDGILLDELYVYSSVQYNLPYTKSINFAQEIDQDDYTDEEGNVDEEAYHEALKEDLRKQAQEYVDTFCYPVVNYTLKANPEKVSDIGDIIRVTDKRIGIDLLTSVIAYEYDAIMNRYVSLEFGNFTTNLSSIFKDVNKQIDIKTSSVSAEVGTKQDRLTSGDNIKIQNNVISADYSTFNGATSTHSGTVGLVPAPQSPGEFLNSNGDWVEIYQGQGITFDNNVISIATYSAGEIEVKTSYVLAQVEAFRVVTFDVILDNPNYTNLKFNPTKLTVTLEDGTVLNVVDNSVVNIGYTVATEKIGVQVLRVTIAKDTDIISSGIYKALVNLTLEVTNP